MADPPLPPGAGAPGGYAPSSLAWKLKRLFVAVHPAGRGEYSAEEVARAINERGEGSISPA